MNVTRFAAYLFGTSSFLAYVLAANCAVAECRCTGCGCKGDRASARVVAAVFPTLTSNARAETRPPRGVSVRAPGRFAPHGSDRKDPGRALRAFGAGAAAVSSLALRYRRAHSGSRHLKRQPARLGSRSSSPLFPEQMRPPRTALHRFIR